MTSLINDYLKDDILEVIVKPNSSKTEVLDWDESRKMIRIAVAAPPEKDKANAGLIKFLKKQTGRRCEIVSGKSSRKKIIKFF